MPTWISAPPEAKEATLKIYRVDNQLVVLLNGDAVVACRNLPVILNKP